MKPWAKRPFFLFLLLLVPLRAFFHSLLTPITLFSGGKQYIVLHMEALNEGHPCSQGGGWRRGSINWKRRGILWLDFFLSASHNSFPWYAFPDHSISFTWFTWQSPIWPLIFYDCDLPACSTKTRQPCNWQCYEEEKAVCLGKHNFFGSWHHSFNEIKHRYINALPLSKIGTCFAQFALFALAQVLLIV